LEEGRVWRSDERKVVFPVVIEEGLCWGRREERERPGQERNKGERRGKSDVIQGKSDEASPVQTAE
jgi:hypothetical protein